MNHNHKQHRAGCGLCGGRTNRRTGQGSMPNPLWGAYGTYPQQTCPHAHHHDHHHGHHDEHHHRPDDTCMMPQARQEMGGCGCGDNGHGNCPKLLQQIRAVDFALYEVVLYLDVYPTSCEALDTYHKLMARRKMLYEQYQTTCGPITTTGNMSQTSWDWVGKPFPWENAAN